MHFFGKKNHNENFIIKFCDFNKLLDVYFKLYFDVYIAIDVTATLGYIVNVKSSMGVFTSTRPASCVGAYWLMHCTMCHTVILVHLSVSKLSLIHYY